MFGVSDHSADKVRHDINTILEAIARLLAKIEIPPAEKPLSPVQMQAELEQDDPGTVIDAEVIEEQKLLTGRNPDLLEGRDRLQLEAIPLPQLLEPETHAQVQLQIGDTYIIALLPDGLQNQLEHLPPEQVEALRQALTKPAAEEAEESALTLTPEAAIVIEQLWDYFDRTGAQALEGEHAYDFQMEGDTLLVLPKDNSGKIVAVDREGRVESTFSSERYEYLMERFAIAYEQMQMAEYQQDSDRDLELG